MIGLKHTTIRVFQDGLTMKLKIWAFSTKLKTLYKMSAIASWRSRVQFPEQVRPFCVECAWSPWVCVVFLGVLVSPSSKNMYSRIHSGAELPWKPDSYRSKMEKKNQIIKVSRVNTTYWKKNTFRFDFFSIHVFKEMFWQLRIYCTLKHISTTKHFFC